MFKLLNDTDNYFPELIYHDENCMTMIIDNVRPAGKKKTTRNEWMTDDGSYKYYERYYTKLFDEHFTPNIIYPLDLNVCCNSIVHSDYVRIIDFGLYRFEKNAAKLKAKNDVYLSKILGDVKTQIQKAREKEKRKKEAEEKRKRKTKKIENKRKERRSLI